MGLDLTVRNTTDKFEFRCIERWNRNLAQELILCLHGIGMPHGGVAARESFFWVTRQAFTKLLDNIVAARATADVPTVITFDDGNASDANDWAPRAR